MKFAYNSDFFMAQTNVTLQHKTEEQWYFLQPKE